MTLNLKRSLVVSLALVGVMSASAFAQEVSTQKDPVEQNKCTQEEPQLVVAPPPPSGCDADKFIRATGCAGDREVWSRTFLAKLNGGEYNYCKQYNNTPFAVLTQGEDGNVVVINKQSCTKLTYKADTSGIEKMKVVGGFVYFTSNDGQLYIVDARGRIFEIQSKNGNSYSKKNGSGVLDIKGDATDPKVLHVTNQSGRFDLTAGQIVSNNNRYQPLLFSNGQGGWIQPPPRLEGDKEETETAGAPAGDEDEQAIAPPPAGYGDNEWGRAKDITAPSYWSQTAYGDLGDCDGTIVVERVNSSIVDISFSARQCSRVDFKSIDGARVEETRKLETAYKPYTGSYRVYGNGYLNRNKAKIVLHSRSGATGVVYYIHF